MGAVEEDMGAVEGDTGAEEEVMPAEGRDMPVGEGDMGAGEGGMGAGFMARRAAPSTNLLCISPPEGSPLTLVRSVLEMQTRMKWRREMPCR